MVSGLVTSPCDHERIFSGLAKLMRMESKSAIRLARSYGLLRYKVVSFLPDLHRGRGLMARNRTTRPAENPKLLNSCKSVLPGSRGICTTPLQPVCLIGSFLRRWLLTLH